MPGGDQVSPAPVNDDRQAGQARRKLAPDIALIHRVQPGTVLQRRSRDRSYPTSGIEFETSPCICFLRPFPIVGVGLGRRDPPTLDL